MEKLVIVAFFILFQFLLRLSSSESRSPCGADWIAVNNSCISVSSTAVSWDDAKRKCKDKESSQLVSIKNQGMNDQIVEILKNSTNNGSDAQFYIGLHLAKSDKRFKWSNGTLYNYSNWRYRNITNLTLSSRVDMCGFYGADFKWLLDTCHEKRRFICQKGFSTPGSSRPPSNSSSATPSTPTIKPTNPCGSDWIEVNNSCINVSSTAVSWEDAQHECGKKNGSKLVNIKKQEMNDQIVEILRNVTYNGSDAQFYIGLYINRTDKLFKWSNGASYNYSNWRYPNITNVTFPSGVSVLCGFYGADFKWLLERCGTPRRFICQKGFSTPGATVRPTAGPTPTSTPTPAKSSKSRTRPTTGSSQPSSNSSSAVPSTPTISINECVSNPCFNGGTCKYRVAGGYECLCLSGYRGKRCGGKGVNLTKVMSDMTTERIMELVEEIEKQGEARIKIIKENGNITEPKIEPLITTDKVVAQVAVFPTKDNSSLTFPSNSSSGNIMLPNSVFDIAKKFDNNSDAVGITSVFLPGLGKAKGILYSAVISAKVQVNGKVNNLTEPVVISLPHGKLLPPGQNASCAFIDVSTSKWSTEGCSVFSSNSSFTVCHCSHLTSFAVLLDVHGINDDMSDTHKFALMIVSMVGCCIALVCFIAALIAFYLIVSERRRRKTETVAIHKNLAIAEIFALVFFLVAYVAVDLKEVCYAVAFLLHYSLMAVFFWMLIEGINLHRGLVHVFVTSSRMKFYKVLGWVTPVLFVVPTAAVGGMDYVREDFCWISHQFIWVFAGPVAVILLVNMIILCIAIRVMITRPRYKTNQIHDSSKSNLEHELRIAFKTIVILLPLLGLTWCLGFLVTQNTTANIVIQYLFGIINSLQGMYFFFAHCVYDEDVNKTVSQQIRNCRNRFPVVTATSNTSTRIKSYFSRTLSHSGQSGSSLSSNSKRISGAYINASYDGRVFEMPSYTSEKDRKISVDSKNSTTDGKANIITNGNHPNGIIISPFEDDSKQEATNPVPLQTKNSAVGFDAYFGSKIPSSEKPENIRVPPATGTPNQQFFRRARSTIVKLSSNHSYPKRANSLSEHLGTRRPLSKQTSSDSSNSGNSNTPILHSGC